MAVRLCCWGVHSCRPTADAAPILGCVLRACCLLGSALLAALTHHCLQASPRWPAAAWRHPRWEGARPSRRARCVVVGWGRWSGSAAQHLVGLRASTGCWEFACLKTSVAFSPPPPVQTRTKNKSGRIRQGSPQEEEQLAQHLLGLAPLAATCADVSLEWVVVCV